MPRWILGWLVTLLLAAPLAGDGAAGPPVRLEACRVSAVLDTVTLRLDCGAGERVVALAGLRAPRPGPPQQGGEPYADESRALASQRLLGNRVDLAGREVRVDGVDVRRELLARGLAQLGDAAAAGESFAALLAAEREARGRRLGLWSLQAWRRHQDSATVATIVPPRPPPAAPEPLAARAARLSTESWERRKAAFDAALVALAGEPPE
jgi:endonuclease YncB( thermonuclease family)